MPLSEMYAIVPQIWLVEAGSKKDLVQHTWDFSLYH